MSLWHRLVELGNSGSASSDMELIDLPWNVIQKQWVNLNSKNGTFLFHFSKSDFFAFVFVVGECVRLNTSKGEVVVLLQLSNISMI